MVSDAILEATNAITIIIVSVACPSLDVSNPLWALGKEISMKMTMAAVAGLNNGEWGDSAQGYWSFGGNLLLKLPFNRRFRKSIKAVLHRGLSMTWEEFSPSQIVGVLGGSDEVRVLSIKLLHSSST